MVQHVSIKCRLIRRTVEYLQEVAAAKVEHELRVQGKVLFEPEG